LASVNISNFKQLLHEIRPVQTAVCNLKLFSTETRPRRNRISTEEIKGILNDVKMIRMKLSGSVHRMNDMDCLKSDVWEGKRIVYDTIKGMKKKGGSKTWRAMICRKAFLHFTLIMMKIVQYE
jgi:hypothetical protein